MRFEYFPYGGSWLPIIPVHRKHVLPSVLALVDTGATHTIMPMEMASSLGIKIDLQDRIASQVAGGTQSFIYPSPSKIEFSIRDQKTKKLCRWNGQVFFSLGQQLLLLGHHQCLEKFNITFKGREHTMELFPLFTSSTSK